MRGFVQAIVVAGLVACAAGPSVRARAEAGNVIVLSDGVRLRFRSVGTGPDTVLVIPGGPAFAGGYLTPALAPHGNAYTFIVLDLRGRGTSDALPATPPAVATQDQDARDIDQVHGALRLGRVGVIAHHSGAMAATSWASRNAHKVRRLLIVGPALARDVHTFDLASESIDSLLLRRAAAADTSTDARTRCAATWPLYLRPTEETDDQVIDRLTPVVCDGVTPANLRDWHRIKEYSVPGPYDWRDTVARLRAPVLVITGGTGRSASADRLNRYWMQAWAAGARDGRTLRLNGSVLFPWATDSTGFAGAVADFLAGAWPRGAAVPVMPRNRPPIDSL